MVGGIQSIGESVNQRLCICIFVYFCIVVSMQVSHLKDLCLPKYNHHTCIVIIIARIVTKIIGITTAIVTKINAVLCTHGIR